MKPASFESPKEPNHILLEEDYQPTELVICLLTWGVEIGHCFTVAIAYLRR